VTQVEAATTGEGPGRDDRAGAGGVDGLAGGGPDGRRGSHATHQGQGFSWVLGWTILGAVLPGSGLIAAGRRKTGAGLLGLVLAGLIALIALAMLGNPVKRVIELAVSPTRLLILAAVAGTVALGWVAVIVVTNRQLCRYASLTRFQQSFSWVVVVALVVGIALPAYEVSHYALIQRDLVTSLFPTTQQPNRGAAPAVRKADPWAGTPRMNVLLIGSDAGADRIGVRPDTLILASIDTATGDTVLFSLPRGLERVPFPLGTGGNRAWPNGFYCAADQCLLNAVWQWAETDGRKYYPNEKRPGLAATEDAVQGVLGLRVDTYAMLNLQGFPAFVNAIGGVTVDVHERLPIGGNGDPASPYYRRATGWIEKGPNQHLYGYRALWFARSRWMSDDFHRMRRQRCIIGAVVGQADPLKVAQSFPAIAKAAKSNISTGIKLSELPAWVDLSRRIQKASVRSLPLDDRVIPNRTDPDYQHIHKIVTHALETPTAAATPAPTPSVSVGPSVEPTAKAKKPTKANPDVAQDVKDVC
jgi:polyisoprenyl-teichoic acid--peptidoglycan teichoic acid transferase